MLNRVNSNMFLIKLFLVSLISWSCNGDEATPDVVEKPDEFEQYGVPFENVADPQDIVMYEVNIRSFSETGDFQGVIDKLDHIKSLGINTIWLMPIHPVGVLKSAGGLGSPYAVRNYTEVNAEFGDLAKFRELVDKSHERGMAVIIDWVANHTSWDNPWIQNKAWYTQINGEITSPAGFNWTDVADLNFSNYEMRKAMINAMKYWVLEANIDGFRCDAADHVPSDFWKQALDSLKAIDNRKLILLAEGEKSEHFASGFQINYAWAFYYNLKDVFLSNKSAASVYTTHQREYNEIPEGAVKLRYTTNHDESAWEGTPIQFFGGQKGSLSALVTTLFISPVPLLYNGQEVGRSQLLPFFTGDPINWTANQDMLQQYEKLMNIYNGTETFREGSLQYFNNPDVVVFTRAHEGETYLIIANVRNAAKEVTLDASLQNASWTNMLDQTDVTTSDKITLQAYDHLVLRKK